MTTGTAETPAPQPPAKRGRGLSQRWFLFIGAIILLNIVAVILVPPFPKGGAAGDACPYPVCFINGTLEFPAPEIVLPLTDQPPPGAHDLITFYPSISNTILTQWIVIVVVLVGAILLTRGRKLIPGRGQNVFETVLRVPDRLRPRHRGADGHARTSALFVSFFLLIIFSNWIGLLPGVGRVDVAPCAVERRQHHPRAGAGLVRHLRGGGLPQARLPRLCRQVLPDLRVQGRASAPGSSRMFVGLVELMLEFVKPITLSMRLFGNIYGGEVALERHHRADPGDPAGRPARSRLPAQRHPGADLQHPDPRVHHARDRGARARGRACRRGRHRHAGGPRAAESPARTLRRRSRRTTTTVSMIPCRRLGE